jgi:hypothetical protein
MELVSALNSWGIVSMSHKRKAHTNDDRYHIRLQAVAANRFAAVVPSMPRSARLALFTLTGTVVLAASTLVYLRGEHLADRLLRVGGRLVVSAAQRPKRVAVAFAAAVLLVWLAIAVRCAWESWHERRRREQSGAVANSPPAG